ncbi:hypothetical protein ACA910_016992 [Epithemia clementina (nom. ined.)]
MLTSSINLPGAVKDCNDMCCRDNAIHTLSSRLSTTSTTILSSFRSGISSSSLDDTVSCANINNNYGGSGNNIDADRSCYGENSYPKSSQKRRLMKHDNSVDCWIQQVWILHFVAGAAVLTLAVWMNGGNRKYVPVDPSHSSWVSGLDELGRCQKVFVNVLASSQEDQGAVVCCAFPHEARTSTSFWNSNYIYGSIFGLCPHGSSTGLAGAPFPFLGRLAKFPDALIIPLFPLLMRIAVRTYQTVTENGNLVMDTTLGVHSFRRLVFYFMLMQFRWWILYLALNKIEDNFISSLQSDSIYIGDYNSSNRTAECWYREWIQETKPFCHGRRFDFSDHVVLYFAQLLPIALLEYLHAIDRPYWPFQVNRRFSVPFLLTVGMLYLYFITYVGVYKTASFFHTPIECFTGFAISLLAQLPLCLLQCSNKLESATQLREFFFGRKSKTQP